MPLRLNVGVSRKLGLPHYGSAGASCNIEVELDSHLLQNDPEGLQAQIRTAFIAAREAVADELVQLRSGPAQPVLTATANGHTPGPPVPINGPRLLPINGVSARSKDVPGPTDEAHGQAIKAATPRQMKVGVMSPFI